MLKKNKICFVSTIPGFSRAFLINYMRELSKENEVFLLSHFDDLKAEMEFFKGITLVNISIERKISLPADVKAFMQMYRFFKQEKPDIVHSGTPKAGLLTMVTARIARVPLRFHTFTGQVWATRKGVLRWLLRNIDKIIYQCATDVLVDSHSQRDFLIQESIIDKKRSYVIGKGSICGVDADRFKPDKEQRKRIRETLHIPSDAFLFFFLGRINKDKGIPELLAAFDRIASENSDAYLLLVGRDEEQMVKNIRKNNLFINGRILYQGITNTPEIYMSAADVMCLPSHREGFGMVTLEAAAVGIPTIGSRITGIIDAIEDGVTGLFHPKEDVAAIYECMKICIVDRNRTKQLGRQARQRALKEFSSKKMTEEFLNYYRTKLTLANELSSKK